MGKIRRSDKTEFLNRFNMGTKREFVGTLVDSIGKPQAWEAVVLPLNYARKLLNRLGLSWTSLKGYPAFARHSAVVTRPDTAG